MPLIYQYLLKDQGSSEPAKINTVDPSILENIPRREELFKIFEPRGNGIEIGVRDGTCAAYILTHCQNLKLYLLDCWEHQPEDIYNDQNFDNFRHALHLQETIKNITPFFPRTRLIKGYADECVEFFPNNFFDFIYIDANHSYKAVKNDIIKWFPKLKNNGLFSGHDYLDGNDGVHNQTIYGVKSAVDEFAMENNLKVYHTNEDIKIWPWRSWFMIKNKRFN